MNKRNFSMDFVRAIATVMIFTFHFNMGTEDKPVQLYSPKILFGNIDMGSMGVTLFFMLSGFGLIYSEKLRGFSVKDYLVKRFWAIYPMFWVAYILCRLIFETFIPHVFGIIPVSRYICYVFTLLGMDTLFSYKVTTFPITGEWFLGCIIIIYLMYPLLRMIFKKCPIVVFASALVLQLVLWKHYPFEMSPLWNPLVRLVEFVFGMLYAELLWDKTKECSNKKSFVIVAVCVVALLYLFYGNYDKSKLWVMEIILFCGIFLFTLLMELGKHLDVKPISIVVGFLSKYSFAIFLVHHPIEMLFSAHFRNYQFAYLRLWLIYSVYVLTIVLLGVFLFNLTQSIVSLVKRLFSGKEKI